MIRVSVIHPSFSWHTVPSVAEQQARLRTSSEPPQVRQLLPRFIRLIFGYVHDLLFPFSQWYSEIYKVPFSGMIAQLPFGLLLKNSDGTRLEEVIAMQFARDAGLPVPRVISYGDHPDRPHAPVSILMTRMPGQDLFPELWEWYLPEEKQVFCNQLREFLSTIRNWNFPANLVDSDSDTDPSPRSLICSPIGTPIRSVRVPYHQIGPCRDEAEFHKLLMRFADSMRGSRSYDQLIADVTTLEALPQHSVKFTHGDLAFHNIMVTSDGRISAILDWEAAGWYPSYWEFTTSWANFKPDDWWYQVLLTVGGAKYERERAGDRARRALGSNAGTMSW